MLIPLVLPTTIYITIYNSYYFIVCSPKDGFKLGLKVLVGEKHGIYTILKSIDLYKDLNG